MKKTLMILGCIAAMCSCAKLPEVPVNELRAPAYPIVTIDPYMSAWSPADELYGATVMHWSTKQFPLIGDITVDGKPYRFMGVHPTDTLGNALGTYAQQTSASVQATSTVYTFTAGPVDLEVKFTAPLLMDDLDLLSRPVNYISYAVKSRDDQRHDLGIRMEAGQAWCLDNINKEKAVSLSSEQNGLLYLKCSNTVQNILGKKGDSVGINWGSFCFVAEAEDTEAVIAGDGALVFTRNLGNTKSSEGKFMVGYDDIYSIQYFGENLRGWWNSEGDKTIEDAFEMAVKEYPAIMKKCQIFDSRLYEQARAAHGQKYAELLELTYRQAIAAHKLVKAPNGDLLWLSKENNSNGSIGTVDVTYPSAPLFLIYNPKLAEGLMNHIYYYSESGKWTKPFPAHDIGTYPCGNGQTYPHDMPVEEAGNMISLTNAVCSVENSPEYALKHWDVLTTWADYLVEAGLDPENQLCTDDFAGHFAHNANLSIKAILGVASYGKMAQMAGMKETSDKYMSKAREMAQKWCQMADAGDHYKLTFDRDTTWSMKYNLVWDKKLGLDIFPESVARKEIKYYKTVSNKYGLPLDSRMAYTKTDWILWTAAMTENQEDFDALVNPVWKFYNETVDRVPASDWTWTDKPNRRMFKARSVVGGFWLPMLNID